MTTINEQNAKQIRKPMEVYVRMDLSDKSITMTYSGYSSAKIADGKLDQTDWKMRKLTDLQGDGYPLDSSCTLYNPATAASSYNGKIGVRGNIGEPVSVTITGSAVMDSATIIVTGASSVSHDGGTSAIIGSSVIVSIEDSSATLTFTPKSADRRVEISDIIPGIMFNVTNENMISCTLSLRADLSIIDPTLPESELNLEFYNDEDISEILAAIPEDTPITYRAGYDGDLSTERKFYVAGQVTYKDNVINVHAVDAVHFIKEINTAYCASSASFDWSVEPTGLWQLWNTFSGILRYNGIQYVRKSSITDVNDLADESQVLIVERGTDSRQVIADVMNLFHLEDAGRFFEFPSTCWFVYVDAGIPTISSDKPSPIWSIRENDCASVERHIDTSIRSITLQNEFPLVPPLRWEGRWQYFTQKIGTVTAYKNGPGYVNFDGYAYFWLFNLPGKDIGMDIPYSMMPVDSTGWVAQYAESVFSPEETGDFGMFLVDSETQQYKDGNGHTVYTQVVPRNAVYSDDPDYPYGVTSMATMWTYLRNKGYVGADDETLEINISGGALTKTPDIRTVENQTTAGTSEEIQCTILGAVYGNTSLDASVPNIEIFPDLCLKSLFNRSPNTGSFTWKGDPRMQPRDVFTFVKLDGTEIDCTIEQIDLEHVGGGTTAKITYREGIV